MTVTRITLPYDFAPMLALIQRSFAYMDGVIDPPSSMHHLTVEDLEQAAVEGVALVIGDPPVACALCKPLGEALYVGKIAVDADQRGQGLARALLAEAEVIAREQGLAWLELQTRVELMANHLTFAALGFEKVAESAHAGYNHPTSITMRKRVT